VTIENINNAKPSVLLIPQDTSSINYSNLKATDGLGTVGYRKNYRGIQIHTAVAISECGEVFGLVAQKIWNRPVEGHGQSITRSFYSPIEEKESYKWLETLDKVGASFPEGTTVVHVCDREGDIYELFCKAKEDGANYLCRRSHNRNIKGEDGLGKLDDLVNSLPEAGRITVQIPRDSHTNRKAREAELAIKHGKCEITMPNRTVLGKGIPKSIEIYFVSAIEMDTPQGEEKVLWQLLTNVPTENFEDAVTRIAWYTQRWKIEIFHRTLKDGCKVEELQYDSSEKLMKLIAIYSIIALEIMNLTYLARTHPEGSCEMFLTEDEWKILYCVANKTRIAPKTPPTVKEAVTMIAKMGGFLGRKSDGNPGVTVIWRGITKFYTILEAVPFLLT
jgi:hypothetical protein